MSSHILASKVKNGSQYMKLWFVIPNEAHEKLRLLADEVGDVNQVVIRAIDTLYEQLFQPRTAPTSTSTGMKQGTQELKQAIERLESKITTMERSSGKISPQNHPKEVTMPELQEVKETNASSSKERPNLDRMLDEVVAVSENGTRT